MPKASFASKDAFVMKSGFNEGWGIITKAEGVVFQYPPNKTTGAQSLPALFARLLIQHTDSSFAATSDEPAEQLLKIADIAACHPGIAKSRDDQDPEDAGEELETVGNCIFTVEEGYKIQANSKYLTFTKSLEDKGFKPEILGEGYFPDLEGLQAMFKTVQGKKFAGKDGGDVTPDYFVVDVIKKFPYEKKAGAGTGSAKKTTPPTTPGAKKTVAAAAKTVESEAEPEPAEEVETADAGSDDPIETGAQEILAKVISEQSGQTMKRSKMNVFCFNALNKSKIEKKFHKAIQDKLRDKDWLTENLADNGVFDQDTDEVTFG